MNGKLGYLRGGFIAYDPGTYPDQNRRRVIPFRINPESISRTVAVQTGQSGGGVEGAGPRASATSSADATPDASTGSLKESFTVQIRLDFADRSEALRSTDEEYGVAPEIAAIEDLLHPAESESEAASDGTEPVRPARPRPVVLFVWGRKRVLPVRIAALKVNETVYNNQLNPVRAEIEVSLEVLGEAEARNETAVRSALDHTHGGRRELARMYYQNSASQGTNILPL
jgi:hypothetical protein